MITESFSQFNEQNRGNKMVEQIQLSNRLKQLASYIDKNSFFADIGTDHAYLPCYVCLQHPEVRAIAGEVNKGPYTRAKETVLQYHLTHRIDVRLGDGLEIIREEDNIDTITISGMGGTLIAAILNADAPKLQQIRKVIAQPNNHAENVRRFLLAHQYDIIDEQMMEENGHIYEMIVGEKNPLRKKIIQDEEVEKTLLFGPKLMIEKSPIFYKKWQMEHDKLTHVIQQMQRANIRDEARILAFQHRLQWIEEVLS